MTIYMKTTLLRALALATLFASAGSAAMLSFTGQFDFDNDIGAGQFTLATDANVRLVSLGASGGVNAAGTTIPGGGFDAVLTLYTFDGTFLTFDDDGANVDPDLITGNLIDPEIEIFLAAGQYRFALTQFDNYPVGDFVDGFLYDFDPSFTAFFGCPAWQFCDIFGNDRINRWAVDVSIEPAGAPIPEPSTFVLLGIGVLAVARRRHRHTRCLGNTNPAGRR